jgi:predicted SnoaL-like aldol condensation-catalyzing enzyme
LCEASLTERNREAVASALDALFVQKNVAAIDEYWADPYWQHNPVAQSGVAAFRSFMGPFVTQSSFQYNRLRTLAECDLAVVMGRYSGTGVIFDMFRLRDGKLMEHWDSDANQASDAGGAMEITDRATTDVNREHVKSLYANALIPNNAAAAATYFANSLVVRRAPTRSGSGAFFDYLAEAQIRYEALHHIIADGNFVFVLAEGTLNGRAYGFYDLFRLDNGLIVEHWDSRRVVPSSTVSGLEIF